MNQLSNATEEAGDQRRDVLKGLAFFSLASTLPAGALAQASGSDFPAPAGLAPKGMFDSRFAIAYEQPVPAAFTRLTEYFSAVARRDPGAIARCLHFPYATYEGVEPTVFETPAAFLAKPPASVDPSGHGLSQIRVGSYDMLDAMELHTFNPVNVGMSLAFTRYSRTGAKIGQYHTIHAVTNNDGAWKIQLSSVIFTPTEYRGEAVEDAVAEHLRQGRDWMLGYSVRDPAILAARNKNSARASAGVRGPGAVPFLNALRDRRPMDPYAWRGIRSRLQVTPAGVDPRARPDPFSFEVFYQMAGGAVGDYGYTRILPDERVLRATVDKAHTYGGYIRYTPDGAQISETRMLGVLTYDGVHKTWASSGNFGQTMYHDWSNDARG